MTVIFLPCCNVGVPQRSRPGNLIPGGRRITVSDHDIKARKTGVTLKASGTVVIKAKGKVVV